MSMIMQHIIMAIDRQRTRTSFHPRILFLIICNFNPILRSSATAASWI